MINKKNIFFYVIYLVLALVLFSLIKSLLEGERGRVKRTIFSAKSAIQSRNLVALNNFISFDYQDQYGNDHQNIMLIAQSFFAEYQDIAVQINDLEIELDGMTANAEMEVLLLARRVNQPGLQDEPLEYDQARIKVFLEKQDDAWRVTEVQGLESEKTYPMEKFIPISKLDSCIQKSV